VAKAAVTDVSPEAATYFDDVIVYRRLAQFVKNANLVARDWPAAASFTNLSFDSPTVNTAAGNTNTDLGQSTLNFPDATVRALTGAGVAQNASFTTSGGYGGLGTVGGGGGLASNVSEVLRIDFPVKAQRFAVTLNRFGQLTGSTHEEQAQLTFFNDGVQVGSPVTLVACHHDADSDDPAANAPAFGLATFAVNVGSDFNRVDIQALTATGGGSQTSLFYVSQLRTCATATNPCVTTFSTANNLCP
jgi:hypothetical protein